MGYNPGPRYGRPHYRADDWEEDSNQKGDFIVWKIVTVIVLCVLVTGAAITSCAGCSNPETPAGHEGYVRQGALFGESRYWGSQVGPTSTGLGWLLEVENVDVRWATVDEDFQVQSADNISLKFKAHITIRPEPGKVKDIVETYGGPDWYTRFLAQPIRNAVYDAVAKEKALDAKDKRDQIAAFVDKRVREIVAGKPFQVQRVVIGAIDFPDAVEKAQDSKVASETLLQQKKFEIEIAKQDAVRRIEEAKGIAEAQAIINQSLTDRYLQHEAIKAQEKMAASPNHTTIYVPSGTNGIPLVRTVN